MKKQYTIKDLANKLEMHHSTVSRALRNHPDVNQKTKELVLETAKKYNYVPNSFAKNLKNSKSKTIVVMVPTVKHFFFSEILASLSNLAFQDGFSVMIYQSNDDPEMESQNLDSIMENRAAGVITSVASANHNKAKYHQLESVGIPVVMFDRFFEDGNFSKVVINNYQGAFDATEYLIQSGKKHIGFYMGNEDNSVFEERYQGYLGALSKHGYKATENLFYKGGIELENGMELIKEIKHSDVRMDGLLCSVDMVALGVISGAREFDIKIPEDLALIGFDNEPAGRIIRPALTTISQPINQVCETSFRILSKLMEGQGDIQSEEVKLKMDLIKRNSA